MKYFLAFVAFAAIFSLAFGSETGCKYEGKSLKVGETYTPTGECTIYECQPNGGVTGKTCPVAATLKPCKHQEPDLKKPYPECCPKLDC